MTPLRLIQMITLAQATTNLVIQFMRIVLKILVLCLQNQAKLFLDDMEIKGPKIICNNKELVPGIRWYVVEHIQNLKKILADLEQVRVTIIGAKFQFCQASIEIVGYICDVNGCHLDTSKILKILD